MNYYERLIKCKNCDHELRLTTNWRLNTVGIKVESMWIREFIREHSERKHYLDIDYGTWKKGR